MPRIPAIAIFDIGKTNKKLLLFDDNYKLLYEESRQLPQIHDEEDFPCEDLQALTHFIKDSFARFLKNARFEIKAVNVTAYGASFVYLDNNLHVGLPLYNYLKPYPAQLKDKFYATYGGEKEFSKITASPVLDNLNSGMQLYRLKYEKPEHFAKIKYALHLPQYISFILSGNLCTDITSIGCHTNLWNFKINKYHKWVTNEGLEEKLPPITDHDSTTLINKNIRAGIGLHDSSAALVPYLISFKEPFVLISTGTWCITLNPFNDTPLTNDELQQDCLCYLSFQGKPVKASRLFAGYEHDEQVNRIAAYFDQPKKKYYSLPFDKNILNSLKRYSTKRQISNVEKFQLKSFQQHDLSEFKNDIEAYYQLLIYLVALQFASTELVLNGSSVKRIYVDGGFSNNEVYMQLLAFIFRDMEVYAATIPQASALGAALVIHEHWNKNPLPANLVDVQYYGGNL
jgi:sugar (pentulose or hexulose) kinase